MTNLLTISSTVPTQANANCFSLVARWKNGKNPDGTTKLVADANRARSVQLPVNLWNDATTGNDKVLQLFVRDAIEELATSYLKKICEDSNMLRTEVPEESFHLATLLAWNAEQAAISGRLNGDTIKEWLSQSVTIRAVTAVHGDAIGKAMGAQFVKLASPNHGLTPSKAEAILVKHFKPEDADSTTGLRVMMRLQAIRDRTESTDVNVLNSIL